MEQRSHQPTLEDWRAQKGLREKPQAEYVNLGENSTSVSPVS